MSYSALCVRACLRLGCSTIKLMINDITSTWQTGNHGDARLNKHDVPAGNREREREREREIWGKEREEDEEDVFFFFSKRFIVIVMSWKLVQVEARTQSRPFKGSPQSNVMNCCKNDITAFLFVAGAVSWSPVDWVSRYPSVSESFLQTHVLYDVRVLPSHASDYLFLPSLSVCSSVISGNLPPSHPPSFSLFCPSLPPLSLLFPSP